MKKIRKFVNLIIALLLLISLSVLLLPRILGVRALTVLSGSMEPVCPTGSLIYVRSCGPEAVAPGDIITYRLREDTLVTHRVVEKEEASRKFRTKGDANTYPDQNAVPYRNLIGKPVFMIPLLGYAAVWADTVSGKTLLLAAAALLACFAWYPKKSASDKSQAPKNDGNPLQK